MAKVAVPFCKPFVHNEGRYIYDVYTNEICEADEVFFDLLQCLRKVDDVNKVRQILRKKHCAESIDSALDRLILEQKKGDNFCSPDFELVPHCMECEGPEQYAAKLSHLILTITDRCNLKCVYCTYTTDAYEWSRPHGNTTMEYATAADAINFFLEHCRTDGHITISIYGGEPLTEPGLLVSIIEYARQASVDRDLSIRVDTNGTLLTTDLAQLFIDNSVTLQISLDGPREHQNRSRQGVAGGSYDLVIEGLRRLAQIDADFLAKNVFFNCVLTPPYPILEVAEFFDSWDFVGDWGIPDKPAIKLSFVGLSAEQMKEIYPGLDAPKRWQESWDKARTRYVSLLEEKGRNAVPEGLASIFDRGLIRLYHRDRSYFSGKLSPTGCCVPGVRRLHVKTDGTFQPCERGGELVRIGSVENGFEPELVNKLKTEFYSSIHERCKSCWAIRFCGVCYVAMTKPLGKVQAENYVGVEECERAKHTLLMDLGLYVEVSGKGDKASQWLSSTSLG